MAYYYNGIQVLPPTAPGQIGSYAWAVNLSGNVIPHGGTIPGSGISIVYMQITSDNDRYNWSGFGFMNNNYLGGLWMNVGPDVPAKDLNYYCVSLWVRIA